MITAKSGAIRQGADNVNEGDYIVVSPQAEHRFGDDSAAVILVLFGS